MGTVCITNHNANLPTHTTLTCHYYVHTTTFKEPTYTPNMLVTTCKNVTLSFILIWDIEPTIQRVNEVLHSWLLCKERTFVSNWQWINNHKHLESTVLVWWMDGWEILCFSLYATFQTLPREPLPLKGERAKGIIVYTHTSHYIAT